jgi:hypothetical protein
MGKYQAPRETRKETGISTLSLGPLIPRAMNGCFGDAQASPLKVRFWAGQRLSIETTPPTVAL